VTQVKNVLGSFRERPPDLEKVASALQTSTRSLRRALHDVGTSYQELLDELRRTRAEEWVRTTDLTFEQMAERLGFSNVRSFRRAFKRWTGRTPGEFRDDDTG
jgi:AraC-like DNA-binding protein